MAAMQSHVYELGFLNGQCSDVRLRAFGHVYHLHRLFLIQSGFFRAMLCGGYAEDVAVTAAVSAAKKHNLASHSRRSSNVSYGASSVAFDDESDIVDLQFDDPNISRAAFEFCIAHLYGGGPKLVLPHWASLSGSHPLSPAFSRDFDGRSSLELTDEDVIGPDAHPATPRFLLSLLATSIYLNVPSITSQALTLILCSVTPYTVIHYLRFAIGKGIEGATVRPELSVTNAGAARGSQWDWELDGPVRTLESLGKADLSPIRNRSASQPAGKQGSKGLSRRLSTDRPRSDADALVSRIDRINLSSTEHSSAASGTGLKHDWDPFRASESDQAGSTSSSPSSSGGKSAATTRQLHSTEIDNRSDESKSFHDSALASNSPSSTPTPGRRVSLEESRVDGMPFSYNRDAQQPDFRYGAPADKIGEVCACWLSRWGFDVFDAEDKADDIRAEEVQAFLKASRRDGLASGLTMYSGRFRTGEIDLPSLSLRPHGELPDPYRPLPAPHLRVWSYPAMPSAWVRAVISSDSFFVRSEWDRYNFAKRVVEMRRMQKERIDAIEEFIDDEILDMESARSETAAGSSDDGRSTSPAQETFGFRSFGFRTETLSKHADAERSSPLPDARSRYVPGSPSQPSQGKRDDDVLDEDEEEYERLFSSGIYYTHMSFQELNRISTDLSPSNGKPYTPLSVLQAALWAGSELKNHIVSSVRSSRAPSLPSWDGDNEEFEVNAANNTALESGNPVPTPAGLEIRSELGISSSLAEFRQACESASAGLSNQSFSRSRASTPFDQGFGLASGFDSPARTLGGIGISPLTLGSAGGRSAQLRKRYYPVASDDTVRYGDGLLSICGQGPGGSGASAATGSVEQGDPSLGAFSSSNPVGLGATGNAIAPLPFTVPLPNPAPAPESLSSGGAKKDRQNFFGIDNNVATGRELGERGAGARPRQEAHKAPRRGASDRSIREETPSLSQFGSLPPEDELLGGEHREAVAEEEGQGGDSEMGPSPGSSERWTGYEPMRLGVEFFGVDKLQEKQRLYSPTFFYAGSIWNLYVQVVKKAKGIQLGIYLHRQSPNETLPQPSAPDLTGPQSPDNAEGSAHLDMGGNRGSRRSPFAPSRFYSTVSSNDAGPSSAGLSNSRSNEAGFDAAALGATFNMGETSRIHDGTNSFLDPASSLGPQSTPVRGSSIGSVLPSTPGAAAGGGGANETGVGSGVNAGSSNSLGSSLSLPGGITLTGGQIPVVPLSPGGPSVYQVCPAPPLAYRDSRKVLRAYFSIHCPSPLGNALTRFSSAPDYFTLSQSWGWKSSSLLGIAYLEHGRPGEGRIESWNRFRCVCTIGVV